MTIFWLRDLSLLSEFLSGHSPISPESSAFAFRPAGKKSLAWLLGCQQSNICRGLAWFQVLPGAFPRSVVELLARISWLWVSLPACLPARLPACSRSVFHLQPPYPCTGCQSLRLPCQPGPSCMASRGGPVCGCPGVCEGAASEFPPQSCVQPSLQCVQGQRRRWPGTGREDVS